MNPTDWQQQLQSGPYKLTERQARNFVGKVKFGGPDECWMWTRSRTSNGRGYGQSGINIVDGKRRALLAHRVMLATVTGINPTGLCACHRCDEPGCCNPRHLWWGTSQQNYDDARAKGRLNSPRGAQHGMARLTEADVRAIRAIYAYGRGRPARLGGVTQRTLAHRFGISENYVSDIVNYRTWRHLTCRDASSSTSKETAYSIPLPASIASPQSTLTLVNA